MARSVISQDLWDKAREYFEHGLSLQEIHKRTGISKGAIGKKANTDGWDKESPKRQALSQAIGVTAFKETMKETGLLVHNELVEEKTRHLKLINDNATKLADKLSKLTDEIDTAQDLKLLVDANDKLAITLKVADRHAPKSDVSLVNAQQNIITVEID